MKKQIFNLLKSILTIIFIYIILSIISGFIGEEIFHLGLSDANNFRLIIVALSLMVYLYVSGSKNILGKGQAKFGMISILLIMSLTLILNHDFTSFSYHNSYLYDAITTGLFEETMYRIVPFHLLDSFFKPSIKLDYWKIYLTTTIFALAHFYNIISINQSVTQTVIQVIYAFCLGSVFAISYLKTHNVIFPIVAYSISDLFSSMFSNTGFSTQVSTDLLGWILIITLIVVTFVINRTVLVGKNRL
ncbi:hypothetical protein FD29_GL000308 [Companilactobacillus mindensis DSM 14500]|uniref:CAAX prenyl protease 2/Lysostaphin resistance protein A-like domain-containing protein n=1 Tax=Companilactobacillus mindensis DSM 14500 TaxID=1423770 RepID=A0A0R1QH02_9LACO|nr:CPBP family intramembrane glutamic endopeptidase [Companilactobacillus mindensis]KRL44079.1 hypothetical protein FD29_GL000308 [Companilactobacillus mindensis DSM 14500]GEO79762.1 hypothetical protein LMI01_20930 [Companilactobacillus mindensis]